MIEKNNARVQHWLKEVLTGPGYVPEKIARAEALWQLKADELIKGDERFPAEARIGVYATGYMLRLLECMQADLPSLYAFWGPSLFDMFGKAYLLQHPSQSYSLFELTAGFADFLDRTRPPAEAVDPEKNIQYDIPAELVRMERARLAALLSKGTEHIPHTGSSDFFSFFSGSRTVLRAHPALQLLVQKMPLVDFYGQLVQQQETAVPGYRISYLAVTRLRFKIRFYELSDWQYHFLRYLQTQNRDVDMGEAVHHTCIQTSQNQADVLGTVCLWLPNAVAMGLVTEN